MGKMLILFVLIAFVLPVFAVDCPPGFGWDRMSGPGCVQSDCGAKGGQYTYTRDCYCGENRRACYEAVNYSGFDAKSCNAFCPNARLIGCADANGKCPNDAPISQNPTPQECSKYCIALNGPNANGTLSNGKCTCSCKEGYTTSTNKISLCQPTKDTCDKYCTDYKETNKVHGQNVYGTVIGASCDCHCSDGYYADNQTLTCVKAANCEELCTQKLGDGFGFWSDNYPKCGCGCKDDYKAYNVYVNEWKTICKKVDCPKNSTYVKAQDECICSLAFNPIPIGGECTPRNNLTYCGDAKCMLINPDPNIIADFVPESCSNCPEDCGCGADQVCNPSHPGNYESGSMFPKNNGCVDAVAKIVEIGCADRHGSPRIPQVDVERADYLHSTLSEEGSPGVSAAAIPAFPGMKLNVFDRVTLRKVTTANETCASPYITLQFGGVRARMMLGQVPLHTLTIKEDAIESGWPELLSVEHVEEGAASVFEIATTTIENVAVHALHAVNFLLFTSAGTAGEREVVKLYVESDIIVNQTPTSITFYTIEGSPKIEFRGKNTTLIPGQKMTVDKNGASTPSNFTASEIDDWFLSIPEPPVQAGSVVNQSANAMPFGINPQDIISGIKNSCLGSAFIVGFLLILAVRSSSKKEN